MTKNQIRGTQAESQSPRITHHYISDNPLWFVGHFLQIVLFLIKSDKGKRSSFGSVCGFQKEDASIK